MTYFLLWLACGVVVGWLLTSRSRNHDSYCVGFDDGWADGWNACEEDFLQEKKDREALRK